MTLAEISPPQVITLGCRLNIAESERIGALVAGERGLVVVNSCAVTAEAVRRTRQAIRRLRRERPGARLLVTGCAAEIERESLAAMPEVDGLVANSAKLERRSYRSGASLREGGGLPLEAAAPDGPRPLPAQGLTAAQGLTVRVGAARHGHTRAFIGVQNGCDHACTFCVIPQGRGESRSLPVAEVLREVERHLDEGAAEVVLTGVDLTSWGHDLAGTPALGRLVHAIIEAFPQLTRLRLSSLDGIEIDAELFELIAGEPRVMPHLHLSLQHGHDLILKRMKRRHLRRDAVELVGRLRERRPEIAIGADLIAGFPTEREEHHAANLSIVRELGVVHGHVFPYSPRPGTPAARMPQLGTPMVRARAAELRGTIAAVRAAWLRSLLGRKLSVLAEKDGTGHAADFARVAVPEGTPPGAIVTVTPRTIESGLLR